MALIDIDDCRRIDAAWRELAPLPRSVLRAHHVLRLPVWSVLHIACNVAQRFGAERYRLYEFDALLLRAQLAIAIRLGELGLQS